MRVDVITTSPRKLLVLNGKMEKYSHIYAAWKCTVVQPLPRRGKEVHVNAYQATRFCARARKTTKKHLKHYFLFRNRRNILAVGAGRHSSDVARHRCVALRARHRSSDPTKGNVYTGKEISGKS